LVLGEILASRQQSIRTNSNWPKTLGEIKNLGTNGHESALNMFECFVVIICCLFFVLVYALCFNLVAKLMQACFGWNFLIQKLMPPEMCTLLKL
jgi:hypothetical protein